MRHILLVANQTATSEPLIEAVRDRIARGDCKFTLVMPERSKADLSNWLGQLGAGLGGSPDAGRSDAGAAESRYLVTQQRLDNAVRRLRELGATVTGDVGQDDAYAAVVEITKRQEFDEIIISTLPHRISHWLRQDVPSRVERKTRLPVTVVGGA